MVAARMISNTLGPGNEVVLAVIFLIVLEDVLNAVTVLKFISLQDLVGGIKLDEEVSLGEKSRL